MQFSADWGRHLEKKRRGAAGVHSPPAAFPVFRLPVELQDMVFASCDHPTRLNLSQTCHSLRFRLLSRVFRRFRFGNDPAVADHQLAFIRRHAGSIRHLSFVPRPVLVHGSRPNLFPPVTRNNSGHLYHRYTGRYLHLTNEQASEYRIAFPPACREMLSGIWSAEDDGSGSNTNECTDDLMNLDGDDYTDDGNNSDDNEEHEGDDNDDEDSHDYSSDSSQDYVDDKAEDDHGSSDENGLIMNHNVNDSSMQPVRKLSQGRRYPLYFESLTFDEDENFQLAVSISDYDQLLGAVWKSLRTNVSVRRFEFTGNTDLYLHMQYAQRSTAPFLDHVEIVRCSAGATKRTNLSSMVSQLPVSLKSRHANCGAGKNQASTVPMMEDDDDPMTTSSSCSSLSSVSGSSNEAKILCGGGREGKGGERITVAPGMILQPHSTIRHRRTKFYRERHFDESVAI